MYDKEKEFSELEIEVKSLLSKRITKEMFIQKTRLSNIMDKYDVIPHEYKIEAPDSKRQYNEIEGELLPERLVVHGSFILILKENNNG